ncbi:MAG: CDP-diacylglycerol--glycerol-3-phosphate 3-phosphatidyltransferase [Tissierella sp.]|uniref:CDP-diacylglycerol--glycerol-3-phosphate 3-phosphatidyltransferase n=1 Tax=Tissierella sp. TaxID=41274 RepID=UPI003F954D47
MNLPNKITFCRVLLVPIFIIMFYIDIPNNQFYAGLIFVIAALTDSLDGYLARKNSQVTNLGKFIDPLADKLLVSAALILLVEAGTIPGWVVITIIAREFTITGFRIIAASEGVTIAASSLGKFKTITQLIAIALLLFNNILFRNLNIPMDQIFLYISLLFTVLSGYDYISKNIDTLNLNDK